jgi:N-hydroxyarylamine O-acetyltransferase
LRPLDLAITRLAALQRRGGNAVNVTQYLARIGYEGSVEPTLANLDALIDRHLASVPFENIDIVRLHRPIVLDPERHFDKIVGERRGGFCYELNGLFAELLRTFGFQVTRGYGVWPTQDGEWTVPFDHIVLAVTKPESGERWLVDVGFGAGCPVVAIPLAPEAIRAIEHREVAKYRATPIAGKSDNWRIEAKRTDTEWELVYEVDLTPREIEAYAEQCSYLQTSPASHFTHDVLCSLPLENGRVTIGGGKFILTQDCERTERPLAGIGDELELLRDWFGIEIDPMQYGGER